MCDKITIDDIIMWKDNPLVNPRTKRKIKENGPVHKKYTKLYEKFTLNNSLVRKKDIYFEMRKNIIDPILLTKLPLYGKEIKDLFSFKEKWNPYNGERLSIDTNGPLYFDPNTLVHYFYTNRLKKLWIEESIIDGVYYEGHYGDAVGNGPNFEINGRGSHPDWHLFRLPIIDCYVDNIQTQAVTMGPILTDEEISKIYKLSKRYKKKFNDMYGYSRPDLIKLKDIYDECIFNYNNEKNKYSELKFLPIEEIKIATYQMSISAVDKLRKFK